ncbi:MAG: porin [Hyphomicrobium sp.]
MNKFSLSALVAAGLLAGAATSASAADLGGNCCADLEERIAELEATTARKGNRKVSLTISGWVAEQVVFWDDGVESNVYVGGIGTTLASHFKLTGQAQISPGWSAGYVMHVEGRSNEPLAWNASTSGGPAQLVNLLQSFWFVKSDTLGKVSVGLQSQASDNTAILVDGSGSLVPANWVIFDGANFGVRNSAGAQTGLTFGSFGFCHHINAGIAADCNGVPLNAVRYDSPTFGGFSVSASWGEDDFWDIAARYAGEFSSIKVAVAAAYSSNVDENVLGGVIARDSQYFQVGAYVQHMPTGLFLYGAYGDESSDNVSALNGAFSVDSDHWYLKAGIRTKLNPLGATVFYGEYAEHNDMASEAIIFAPGATESELQRWGLGIVQEVDAAAMSVWLKYRNMDASTDAVGLQDLQDIDFVGMGALINF